MRILMAKGGHKMAEIEEATGLSNSTLRNMKRGKTVGSIPNLCKVASFFGVSVIEYLLEGQDVE
jgi:transcriptional regulator with XRE-family HTH domain